MNWHKVTHNIVTTGSLALYCSPCSGLGLLKHQYTGRSHPTVPYFECLHWFAWRPTEVRKGWSGQKQVEEEHQLMDKTSFWKIMSNKTCCSVCLGASLVLSRRFKKRLIIWLGLAFGISIFVFMNANKQLLKKISKTNMALKTRDFALRLLTA